MGCNIKDYNLLIDRCNSLAEAKKVWQDNRDEIKSDTALVHILKDKVMSFHPTDAQINEWKAILPPLPRNINLIIIPDFSLRIKENLSNESPVDYDTAILNHIWAAFEKHTHIGENTKHCLRVDITGEGEIATQMCKVADSLIFDLSKHKPGQSNRLYYSAVGDRFYRNTKKLYDYANATQKTAGADYVNYFANSVAVNLKKSNLYDSFINKIIIITDGYLEATKPNKKAKLYTGSDNQIREIAADVENGMPMSEAFQKHPDLLQLPHIESDISKYPIEILMLEIRVRDSQKDLYNVQPLLKYYWQNVFFKHFGIDPSQNNPNWFISHATSKQSTFNAVNDFLSR
ncbi:MAG: hypothetical protein EBX41_07430 [Chitinophagia bacterium]|nr:hypothetical protein [Chitinophagia bacterium]